MSLGAWRTAIASAAGTSHVRTGTPCQDAGRCEVLEPDDGGQVLIASVSDGAGSASHSEHGAGLAVGSFHRTFSSLVREQPGLGFFDEDCARRWLTDLQHEITAVADGNGLRAQDYACTFLGAVVGPTASVFVQVGDGAIVVADGQTGGGHAWITWPQHGEFANSTFFVTMEEAADIMAFTRREATDGGGVRELAMFSDGLERLILNMQTRSVHSPSLRPILDWLARTDLPATGATSAVLAAYLDSPNVNRRTDDDKTLVLATRATPPDEAA